MFVYIEKFIELLNFEAFQVETKIIYSIKNKIVDIFVLKNEYGI